MALANQMREDGRPALIVPFSIVNHHDSLCILKNGYNILLEELQTEIFSTGMTMIVPLPKYRLAVGPWIKVLDANPILASLHQKQ